jgi:serine/threonine protein phosphatase PrpC
MTNKVTMSAQEAESVASDPYTPGAPGSTALGMLIKDGKVHIANAGDCRAVLCRSGQAVQLTTDHVPDNDTEHRRITAAGGFVANGRVNGSLLVARGLGDFAFKKSSKLPAEQQLVTAYSEVLSQPLEAEDEFIVMGCDGIWETLTPQQVVSFVKERLDERRRSGKGSISNVAANLCDRLMAPDILKSDGIGLDNMSCIIVEFPSKYWEFSLLMQGNSSPKPGMRPGKDRIDGSRTSAPMSGTAQPSKAVDSRAIESI